MNIKETKKFTVEVKENGDYYYIDFPDELRKELGWQINDTIRWIDNGDGTWTLEKAHEEMKNYLVESIVTYRMRHVVKAKNANHAMDEVVFRENDLEFKEFSQLCLGSQISSIREISNEDVLNLCDDDNRYASTWSDEKKIETFVNVIEYEEDE